MVLEPSLNYVFTTARVRPLLEYPMPEWKAHRNKDIDMLDRVERSATKMKPKLWHFNYEITLKESDLRTIETNQ